MSGVLSLLRGAGLLDQVVNLFAVYRCRPVGFDSDTNLVARDVENRHANVIADDNGFSDLPCEDKHS